MAQQNIFYKNIFALKERGEMKYGEDKNTLAKENIIENKNFGLTENKTSNIPNWAAPYTTVSDKDFKTKLIDAFFKDDVLMQQYLSETEK